MATWIPPWNPMSLVCSDAAPEQLPNARTLGIKLDTSSPEISLIHAVVVGDQIDRGLRSVNTSMCF